ncbi:Dolichyl-phosphate-mannose-protein mannosyltransferase [Mucilaginibacter pineti]|uniref:Dolichyl-phosphate-mannose-protein mannosyltransferase n=1 Tax=Mucilaginibacter pineti TaxID=1391627 RepID=A0A1G7CW25_9SPHI|nr:glycosyltransferase family 39 protein [Mucilaginibacter pineti]SDE43552.1 Dolichyl-phosphate-mannose-protein mannosyltransferase [Mucilaginibacter pineti]
MPNTALNNTQATAKYSKPVIYFLLLWTALNALQAYTLEVHADEAYYWVFSRMMDWGFYYHPPMVAVFIRIGDTLMHNELGTRLVTLLSSTAAIYLIWLMLQRYAVSAKWFVVLTAGILVFHVYGFTATPDAPLLFFAVLFYFFYQKYLDNDSWKLALVLGFVVACLMYSKYHGILLVGFTLLANLKLLKRGSFYFIVILALALYVPHLLWQYHHNFPAVNFNLFERSEGGFDITYGFNFLGAQLLIGGPLISWFLFYSAFTTKIKDAFIRCLMVNAIGVFAFFYLNTLKVDVQPHYTLIAFVPLIMLTLIRIKQKEINPAWLYRLAVANIVLIVAFRLCLVAGFDFLKQNGQLASYYGFHDWARAVQAKAGDSYVIMKDEYQNPSKYCYYTNSLKGFAYDSRFYRTTQFDMWPLEDSLQHKKVYYLTLDKIPGVSTDSVTTSGKWYGGWVNDARTYQKVICEPSSLNIASAPGKKIAIKVAVTNPYPFAINFGNVGATHSLFVEACLYLGPDLVDVQPVISNISTVSLKPGEETNQIFTIITPRKKGHYQLFFSWRTEPFVGSRNSSIIQFTVK